jgi:hypothetical protein
MFVGLGWDGMGKENKMTRGAHYLCKGARIELILARELQPDIIAGLGVPGGLCAGLDLAVDEVVVAGGEDAQVVGRLDGGGVLGQAVADGGRVARHRRLLHVVAGLGADQEALVAQDRVDVGGGALEEVEEGAEVEVGLLVVQVYLAAVGLFGGEVVGEDFGAEAFGELVFELDFGVQRVGGGPGLGEGEAWRRRRGGVA